MAVPGVPLGQRGAKWGNRVVAVKVPPRLRGYSVNGGRPEGTTEAEGYCVSGGKPEGTTEVEGYSVGNGVVGFGVLPEVRGMMSEVRVDLTA